ncbi:hypothetical protein Zmor_006846 [Zophobas morio]|uniref:Uncharacterized protein n=1 Tax=Zophobas morio TaxID=2755281 RepID=A0AA38IUJ2_9CUCU|nr:hypothetical protein Zmor_006846 [Zophobas morio]
MWTSENPHFFIESPQYPQKVGVWAAISQHRVIGPIFFYGNINAARYRDEILSVFLNQLDDEELVITHKINDINNSASVLENVANAVRRRARLCLQEGGSHFQHLL